MQEKLKIVEDAINNAIEKIDDKDIVQALGSVKDKINEANEAYVKLQDENKGLLKDYKDLIQHSSYTPKGQNTDPVPETPNFEKMLLEAAANRGKQK